MVAALRPAPSSAPAAIRSVRALWEIAMCSTVHSEATQRQDGAGSHFGPTRPNASTPSWLCLVMICSSGRSCMQLLALAALIARWGSTGETSQFRMWLISLNPFHNTSAAMLHDTGRLSSTIHVTPKHVLDLWGSVSEIHSIKKTCCAGC